MSYVTQEGQRYFNEYLALMNHEVWYYVAGFVPLLPSTAEHSLITPQLLHKDLDPWLNERGLIYSKVYYFAMIAEKFIGVQIL